MAVSKGFELATLGSGLDVNQSTGEVVTINMDTDVVAEGTTNLYFTDERVDDRVSNLLVAGSSVSLTYDDGANTLTIALDTAGGLDLSNNSTADLPEDPAATTTSGTMYYTDTRVQTYLSSGGVTSIETTGNVIIGGNLTVNGSSSTINSTELTVDDLNITIASGAPDAASANGAGLTVDGANATIIYDGVNDRWVFNKTPHYNALRLLTTNDLTGSDNFAFKNISDGVNIAVADSNTATFNVTSTDQIEVSINATTDTLTIGHANSGVSANSYGGSTAIPIITIDAQGHVTAASTASIITSWNITDGTTTQQIAGGNTLTVIDGTDIDAVVSATDQLTINNISTLQTVTGRGATTTNAVGIGTNSITSGFTFDVNGTSFLRDALTVRDTAFSTAYNSVTGVIIDSSHIEGGAAGYGNSISFTGRNTTLGKKAAIALYQQGTDNDDVNLRFFVSNSNTFVDPVTLALELQRGGQVKISDAYTLPTADGTVNQVLITNGGGALSFATIDTTIDWNVANNYAFKTISVVDSTAGFSFTATGNAVADSNTDILTLVSGTGINLNVDTTNDAVVVNHGDTSSVADLTAAGNTFVNALTFDTHGHVLTRTTAAVDFDVSTNYAYKFMTDGTNTAGAASNVDTFTFTNGTDTTAVVNAAADSITFNNTSTLDSVTGRGNTTTNSITVGNATVNGNLTVTGSTTTLNTTNLVVEDPVIVLAKNQTTPANDIGFIFQRYSSATSSNYNVAIVWNETSDRLVFGETTETGADNAITLSSEWMTVTDAGRVGIGTTNPALQLDIHGGAIRIANATSYNFGFDTQITSIILGTTTGQARRIMVDQGGYGRNLIGITAAEDIEIGNSGTVFIRNVILQHSNSGTGGHVIFATSDGENVRVQRNGNVGFGTNNPQTKLHLYANNDGGVANNTLRFEDADAGTAVNQQLGLIEFYSNDTSVGSSGQKAYIGAFAETLTPQAYLAFATDGTTGTATERMRITSAGDVGIGTTNILRQIHIYDTGATTAIRVESGDTSQASVDLVNSAGSHRLISNNGAFTIFDQGDTTNRFVISTLGAITFNNAYTFPTADGSVGQALITNGAGNVSFGSLSATIDWNVAANYAFQTIATPAGTNPVADSNTDTLTLANGTDISITGNATTDTVTIANTSTLQSVTNRGATTTNNVGIGTTDTSSSKLSVTNNVNTNTDWYTDTQATVRLRNINASGNAVLKFQNALSRIVYGLNGASDKLIFSSRQSLNTTSKVITFNNDGEVGIGTVDPTARLHIGPFNGGTTSPHLLLTSSNNAFGWRIDTQDFGSGNVPLRIFRRTNGVDTESLTVRNENGRVGIGSTNPEQQLTVGTGNLQVNDGFGWFKADAPTTNVALRLGQYSTDPNTSFVDIETTDETSYVLDTIMQRFVSRFRWSRTSPAGRFNPMELFSLGSSGGSSTRLEIRHQDDPVSSTAGATDVRLATGGVDASWIRRGNVGIGTNNPLAKLHIQSSTSADAGGPDTLLLENTGTAGETAIAYKNSTTGANYWFTGLNQGNNFDFAFGTSFGSGFVKLTITNDGNVGIGITNPTNALHVERAGETNILVKATSTGSARLYLQGTGGGSGFIISLANSLNLQTNTNADIIFSPNNTEVVRVKSSNASVGIGTNNPQAKLHVNIGAGTAGFDKGIIIRAGNNSFTTGHGAMLQFENEDVIQAGIRSIRESSWASGLQFYTHTATAGNTFDTTFTEKMRINAAGNVGIGVTNPDTKLKVAGEINSSSATNAGRISFGDTSNNIAVYRDNSGDLVVHQGFNSGKVLYLGGLGDVVVSIDSNNNQTGKAFRVRKDSLKAGTELFTVLENGNVGIGTTIPDENLHIFRDLKYGLMLQRNSFTDNAENLIRFSNSGVSGVYSSYIGSTRAAGLSGAGHLVFGTAPSISTGTDGVTERMRITPTGNVGIGTTTPAAKLHVDGAVRIDSAYEYDSASASLSTITQTVIATWSASTYGGGKVVIQALDTISGDRQMSEMLVTHDGTNVEYTEYANISTGNTLATYIFDISGGNVRLLATGTSANSTQYKVVETLVLA